jgi:type 1 glutamine amidotransferase
MKALLALLLLTPLPSALAQDESTDVTIGGVPYVPLGTREATAESMRRQIQPELSEWGVWYQLSPFPYDGHGNLHVPCEPEEELTQMVAGGPGPVMSRTYTGKQGVDVRWRPLGVIDGVMHSLHHGDDPELNDNAIGYLYTSVLATEDFVLPIDCGSDDGIRMWVNGELVLDHDVARGLSVTDEHVDLPLVEGRNHILVKISEGVGGWDFQINVRKPLPPAIDAELTYWLDRDFPPSPERAYWRALTMPVPEDLVLEVGGLDFMPDGSPIVCTRRGDVVRVLDTEGEPPLDTRYEIFASGLHEPLGVGVREDADGVAVYCVQRGELTRLRDTDGDGAADMYETFSDGWGVSGNYHEFAFGPEFDAEGNAWVTLNVGFCGSLGKATVPYRGWALKITPDGEVVPVCDGLRSPNGIGAWTDGEMFYVDNQGDYVATNRLSHLAPGSWHGHPASLRWRDDLASPDERPPRQPAAVWFPYATMGQSAADVALCDEDGRFGPFDGQLFVGDQTRASVMRVFLEQVDGVYQGACFPFVDKLDSGVNRVAFAPDGSMWVGQTDRGWGSVGRRSYGLQRIEFLGETPFEMLAIRADVGGFEVEFTRDLDVTTALDPSSWTAESWTYEYHAAYGAPEDDKRRLTIGAVTQVAPRRVHVAIDGMRAGYVHELRGTGVRDTDGASLLHDRGYYTLQRIPGQAEAEAGPLPRVVFLTHSAGFVHDVVKRPRPGIFAHAEERLIEAAHGRFDLLATQDPGVLTAEALAGVDALVMFTTGELPTDGAGALVDWVRAGGALIGVHAATDTWYEQPDYGALIGGVFDGHPWTQEVGVVVEDPTHPAVRHLGERFVIDDEIYQFRDFRRHPTRVLLSLDTAGLDMAGAKRADGDYALAWTRAYGEGRVFYTALGHRRAVWSDARFTDHLLAGVDWALSGADDHAPPPPGAVVLLGEDGAQDAFVRRGAGEAAWTVLEEGVLEVAGGAGDVVSREVFGDALIHVEFRVPDMRANAEGQGRGNSGVYVAGRYEVQVLDSYGIEPELGDCGAIYGQHLPATNACREPGRWQTYDIDYRAPRFGPDGAKTENARLTVWQNGILIHDDVELSGPTGGALDAVEAAAGPLLLQDHGNPVRYRNVWVLPRS